MRTRYHRDIPELTISSWLTEYRSLTTYSRLRASGRKLFPPDTVIRGNGTNLLTRNLRFRTEPIVEVVAVFPAACLIDFVRLTTDLGD